MAKKKEKVEINKITQEEGTIEVIRTLFVSGKEIDSDREVEKIKVRPFLCQPAYISVKVGETVPLAQPYASKKLDISISHPCYKEELVSVLDQVLEYADERLEEELGKIENAVVKRKKSRKKSSKKDQEETAIEEKAEALEKRQAQRKSSKKKVEINDEIDDLDDLLSCDSEANTDPVSGIDSEEEDDELADFI